MTTLDQFIDSSPDEMPVPLLDFLIETDSEEAFQHCLDRKPDWHGVRLRFAYWLEERGDARAQGTMALARLRVHPVMGSTQVPGDPRWYFLASPYKKRRFNELPRDWLVAACGESGLETLRRMYPAEAREFFRLRTNGTLRRASIENAVARAFLDLPVERRAELLKAKAVLR